MATCDVCGQEENLPYQCRRCGGTFCAEHRLPESHDCPGLQVGTDSDAVFDSGFDESVSEESSGGGRFGGGGVGSESGGRFGGSGGGFGGGGGIFDRLTGPGGLLDSMTKKLLAVLWVVFLLQGVVLVTLGPDWVDALFVLSTDHPHYVWTWVTAVFSHAGLFHIAANSIVLFFFGPLVERLTGERTFAAFFVAAGVIAGVGQMLIELGLGTSVALVGASGATFAILGVLTVLRPNLKILLFFVVPMKLKYLTYGTAVVSIVFVLYPPLAAAVGLDDIAHLAHLIGFLIGLAYGKRLEDRVSLGRGRVGGPRGPRGPRGPGGPGGRR